MSPDHRLPGKTLLKLIQRDGMHPRRQQKQA
jgi:hypothetical protein